MNLKNTVRIVKWHEQVCIVMGVLMEPTVFRRPISIIQEVFANTSLLTPLGFTHCVDGRRVRRVDWWMRVHKTAGVQEGFAESMALSQSLLRASSRNRAAIRSVGPLLSRQCTTVDRVSQLNQSLRPNSRKRIAVRSQKSKETTWSFMWTEDTLCPCDNASMNVESLFYEDVHLSSIRVLLLSSMSSSLYLHVTRCMLQFMCPIL